MMVNSMLIDMFDVESQVARLRDWLDLDFYRSEYPDITLKADDLIEHYFRVGWIEGRNPNPFFDTVSYLLSYKDVAEVYVNPYCHYLVYGIIEGRLVTPSSTPSIRTELVFGRSNVKWAEDLAQFIDTTYALPHMPGYELATGKFSASRAAHFAYRGWRENISPNKDIDIRALKRHYPFASSQNVNPLLAYIEESRGTYKEPLGASASTAGWSETLADTLKSLDPEDLDKIDAIRDYFDQDFYLATHSDVRLAGVDPLLHYYFEGWREGRSPRHDFDTGYYLTRNPDVVESDVCPLWHYVKIGRDENRAAMATYASVSTAMMNDRSIPQNDARTPAAVEELEELKVQVAETDQREQLTIVREALDAAWYLSTYPDVKSANIDPAEHYYYTGWRENRNPSRFFTTEYYLSANADVRLSGANPFWHYLVAGRAEGRLPRRLGGWRREALVAAKEPHKRTEAYVTKPEKRLSAAKLAKTLKQVLNRKGCILSVSHDSYVNVIGGTQIFIADEQRRFNQQDLAYLHLSPVKPLLALSDPAPEFEVRITLDGLVLGSSKMSHLLNILQTLRFDGAGAVAYIIHCVFGFAVEDLIALQSFFQPQKSIFWLHDFSSVCEGFNLLRNDITFCGAPEPTSLGCRVCIYGEHRARHVSRLRHLFEQCRFQVVAPSQCTVDIWSDAVAYKSEGVLVHPHWKFVDTSKTKKPKKRSNKTSIGFLGYPSTSKGWPIFLEFVDEFQEDERYTFLHLAARNTSTASEVKFIVTEVTDTARSAPINIMKKNNLDFIAILSQWPETFSFAAYEAIAAGVSVLCFAGSGNVAAQAKETGCGVVFSDKEELFEFFRSGEAIIARAGMYERGNGKRISETGTSASLCNPIELANEN